MIDSEKITDEKVYQNMFTLPSTLWVEGFTKQPGTHSY